VLIVNIVSKAIDFPENFNEKHLKWFLLEKIY